MVAFTDKNRLALPNCSLSNFVATAEHWPMSKKDNKKLPKIEEKNGQVEANGSFLEKDLGTPPSKIDKTPSGPFEIVLSIY